MCRKNLFPLAEVPTSEQQDQDLTESNAYAQGMSQNPERVLDTRRSGDSSLPFLGEPSEDISEDDSGLESSDSIDTAPNDVVEAMSLSSSLSPTFPPTRDDDLPTIYDEESEAREHSVRQMVDQEWHTLAAQYRDLGEWQGYSFFRNMAHARLEERFDRQIRSAIANGLDVTEPRLMQMAFNEVRRKSADIRREIIQNQVSSAISAAIIQTPKIHASFLARLHDAHWIKHEIAQIWVREGRHLHLTQMTRALPRLWNALCSCWDNKNFSPLVYMDDIDVEALFKADLELESANPGAPRPQPVYYPSGSHSFVNGMYIAQP